MAWFHWGKKKEKKEEVVETVEAAESTENVEAAGNEQTEEPAAPIAEETVPVAAVPEERIAESIPVSEAVTPAMTVETAPETDAAVTEAEDVVEEEAQPKKKAFGWFSKKKEAAEEPEEEDDEDDDEDEDDDVPPVKKKKGFFARLKEGLSKTRDSFVYNLDVVFDGAEMIDDDFFDDLEEILIMGDIGVGPTEAILDRLREQIEEEDIVRPSECKRLLIQNIREQMAVGKAAYRFEKETSVVFVIGVNGVGKTTSIGKIASMLKRKHKKVMMAAADTFRAAAGDQLKVWAERAGVELIGGKEGQDPSSVLFDAVNAAKARRADVLLVDTAGRLNNKKNLMEELKKMNRVIDREFPDAHRENLIVLDATTGQNALQQARDFNDVADLTGIILTKMDGTAKGGIAIAIQSELKVPVKYIGVGEKIEDLQKFDADAFVEALFDVELEKDEEEDDEEDGEE